MGERLALNLGCGEDKFGDVRLDIHRTSAATLIANVESTLPFKDEVFDVVLSVNLFEHLMNPGLVLTEMARVCKKGGAIELTTDNAGWWRFHLPKKLLSRTASIETLHGAYEGSVPLDRHFSIFEPEHLRNHFQAASLEITELRYAAIPSKRTETIASRVYYLLCGVLIHLVPVVRQIAYPQLIVNATKVGERVTSKSDGR